MHASQRQRNWKRCGNDAGQHGSTDVAQHTGAAIAWRGGWDISCIADLTADHIVHYVNPHSTPIGIVNNPNLNLDANGPAIGGLIANISLNLSLNLDANHPHITPVRGAVCARRRVGPLGGAG